MITYSTAVANALASGKGRLLVVRLTFPIDAAPYYRSLYFSDRSMKTDYQPLSSLSIQPRVMKWVPFSWTCDPKEAFVPYAGWNIELSNLPGEDGQTLMEQLYNQKLYHALVEWVMYFRGEPASTNIVLITSYCNGIASYDRETVSLEIPDGRHMWKSGLTDAMTETDFAGGCLGTKKALGNFWPIVYGEVNDWPGVLYWDAPSGTLLTDISATSNGFSVIDKDGDWDTIDYVRRVAGYVKVGEETIRYTSIIHNESGDTNRIYLGGVERGRFMSDATAHPAGTRVRFWAISKTQYKIHRAILTGHAAEQIIRSRVNGLLVDGTVTKTARLAWPTDFIGRSCGIIEFDRRPLTKDDKSPTATKTIKPTSFSGTMSSGSQLLEGAIGGNGEAFLSPSLYGEFGFSTDDGFVAMNYFLGKIRKVNLVVKGKVVYSTEEDENILYSKLAPGVQLKITTSPVLSPLPITTNALNAVDMTGEYHDQPDSVYARLRRYHTGVKVQGTGEYFSGGMWNGSTFAGERGLIRRKFTRPGSNVWDWGTGGDGPCDGLGLDTSVQGFLTTGWHWEAKCGTRFKPPSELLTGKYDFYSSSVMIWWGNWSSRDGHEHKIWAGQPSGTPFVDAAVLSTLLSHANQGEDHYFQPPNYDRTKWPWKFAWKWVGPSCAGPGEGYSWQFNGVCVYTRGYLTDYDTEKEVKTDLTAAIGSYGSGGWEWLTSGKVRLEFVGTSEQFKIVISELYFEVEYEPASADDDFTVSADVHGLRVSYPQNVKQLEYANPAGVIKHLLETARSRGPTIPTVIRSSLFDIDETTFQAQGAKYGAVSGGMVWMGYGIAEDADSEATIEDRLCRWAGCRLIQKNLTYYLKDVPYTFPTIVGTIELADIFENSFSVTQTPIDAVLNTQDYKFGYNWRTREWSGGSKSYVSESITRYGTKKTSEELCYAMPLEPSWVNVTPWFLRFFAWTQWTAWRVEVLKFKAKVSCLKFELWDPIRVWHVLREAYVPGWITSITYVPAAGEEIDHVEIELTTHPNIVEV